jgi:gamma-glutamyl:cysteine ligase YbdK (ATP-grasp superfamily)
MAGDVKDFVGARLGTLGIEAEFFLADMKTGTPVPNACALIYLIYDDDRYTSLRGLVSPEFDSRMIEYKTGDGGGPPHQLVEDFRTKLWLLMQAAAQLNCLLLPTAHYNGDISGWTHFTDPGGPFEDVGVRYAGLEASVGILKTQPRIPRSCAIQSHFAVPLSTDRHQRDIAVAVCDIMTSLVPMFAAVAANSPFKDMDSRRLHYWTMLPRGGPYLFGSYERLVSHARDMVDQRRIATFTELWYHERFNKYTLESRAMDMSALFEHLVAFVVTNWATKMALWNALRYGELVPRIPSLPGLAALDLSKLSISRPQMVPLWDFRFGTLGRWTNMADGLDSFLDFIRPTAGDWGLAGAVDLFAKIAESRHNGAAINRERYAAMPLGDGAYRVAAEEFTTSVLSFDTSLLR